MSTLSKAQIVAIRDMAGVPASTVATCNAIGAGILRGRAYAGAVEALRSKYLCEGCDEVNERWNEANRCVSCSADFHERLRRDPECRPVGSR